MITSTLEPDYFAKQLRELRRFKGLTQESVAETCGLSLRTIEKLESGRHLPAEQSVRSLCRGLGIKRSYFLKPSEEAVARERAAIEKAIRTTTFVPTRVIRTTREMLSSLDGFHAWNCDVESVDDQALEMAMALAQNVFDWCEVWSDIALPERLDAAARLAEACRELDGIGALVHMGRYRAVRRYSSGPALTFTIGLLSVRPAEDSKGQKVAMVELGDGWELPADEAAAPLDLS